MNHSSKTWDLAQRTRKVSKGQAKIFLTRSAGEEQRLAKLTQHLDKEKAARKSQLNYAQKLLLKRYGAGKIESEGTSSELRTSDRDRSQTWPDPTFITRSYNYNEERKPGSEMTAGRVRTASSSASSDFDGRNSNENTRGPAGIPRVHSQGNVTNLKESRKISFSVEDLLRNRSNCSRSEGEIYKRSNGTRPESPKSDAVQERRPRALSEVLPPVSLPPIFKADKNSKMTGRSNTGCPGVLVGGNKTYVNGKSTGRTRVAELAGQNVLTAQTRSGRKTSRESIITDERTMNDELRECRYLRTRNFED